MKNNMIKYDPYYLNFTIKQIGSSSISDNDWLTLVDSMDPKKFDKMNITLMKKRLTLCDMKIDTITIHKEQIPEIIWDGLFHINKLTLFMKSKRVFRMLRKYRVIKNYK